MKPSLCLMVWNELPGCQVDVPLLPRDEFLEVYAVDGGSTDGTVEFLEAQGIPVYKQPRRGLNAAYHYAVELCRGDALVVFFPKATIDPACTVDIARGLDSGAELVIASRNIAGGSNEEDAHWLKPRKWGVMLLALGVALLWKREGAYIRDVLHGVKGFAIASFHRMQVSPAGLTVDLEMVVRAYRFRISRAETPVCETPRIAGTTHFRILPVAKKLARFLFNEVASPAGLVSEEIIAQETVNKV